MPGHPCVTPLYEALLNRRLHRAWERFNARDKMRTKANTAIARELAGWCWSVAAPLQQGATAGLVPEGAAMEAA